ncbi:LCP family protein [Nocardia sp. NBC_01009]|uniref:LCP family protein n=1 Tax=Nocardia sp. NBC_01009 TaxID=2975996 RepID=UPI00386E2857|nr:LCP family protein [Nocardia sp. NBC_01009]
MGDDRHGRSPRPGDRAPWERYPTADYTERDDTRSSRRSRHTDAESGSAPLTVQDLVQKVDNERGGRRRRAATEGEAAPAGPPARRPETARPADSAPPRESGTPQARPAGSAPPRESGTPQARPAGSAPQRPTEPARPAGATGARRAVASPVVDDIAGTPSAARPAVRRTAEDPRRSAPSAPGAQEPPEVVTDIIPPVNEPAKTKRRGAGWPTTESDKRDRGAQPKTVGNPPLSRLAASKQRRNKRLQVAGRVSGSICAAVALLITGGGWSYMNATANSFNQVNAIDDNSEDVVDSGAQLGDENFLLVGTDTRAGVNGKLGAGTIDDAEGARADTAMLVHIPKNRSRVVVVSFPRDLDVTRPQCNGWDNDKGENTQETFPSAIGDKLNAVYALGGPKCLVTTIQRLTGSTINHFIGIDFAGFEAMVDQVGGVEVCAPKPVKDEILGTVLETAGKQRINGETALNYVRARHVYGEERSDYDRIARQQRFLASLLRGALSSRVLFDPVKLNGFIKAFTDATFVHKVDTNDLLTLGRSLQKMDAGAVTFLTIPTAGTTSYGNEIPRESDIKAIFKAIRDDQPLPGEKKVAPAPGSIPSAPPTPPKLIAVDPSTVSLLVSNGSTTVGAANKAATKFGNLGFPIYNTANYSLGNSEVASKVRYGAGHEAEAATVASSLPGATMEQSSDLGGIIEVVIGADYTGNIRPPTPVGDPISNVNISTSSSSTPVPLPSDLEHVNAADETCK